MKKTISVNIKGLSFTIEEDAYELLQDYLERLGEIFAAQQGGDDILEDIEIRIAELFNGRLNESKSVIELKDVQEVLATLGNPEEILTDSEDEPSEEQSYSSHSHSHEKRLFRDEENAMIGGVCAGLANYFNMDISIIRIIFVATFLFAGFGFPLYIILWIAVPRARNTIDRLRMKGRPITVENVRSEVEQAADRIKESTRSFNKRMHQERDSYKRRAARGGRILTAIIGFILIMMGLVNLVGFMVFIVGGTQIIPVQSDTGFLSITELGELLLSNPADIQLAWIGGLMVVLSIILFLFLAGSMLLFRIHNRWGKRSLAGLIITGFIGFFICLTIGMRSARDIAVEGGGRIEVGHLQAEELTILPQLKRLPGDKEFQIVSNGDFGFFSIEGKYLKTYGIDFEFTKSADSSFHIYQNLNARGHSHLAAVQKSKRIRHGISLTGDTLMVDTEYSFPKSDKIRLQDVVITIEIPENGKIRFKDKIIYIGSESYSEEVDHPYYHEEGYLRGDGKYEHNTWW